MANPYVMQPAKGDDFVGRKASYEKLKRYLKERSSIILVTGEIEKQQKTIETLQKKIINHKEIENKSRELHENIQDLHGSTCFHKPYIISKKLIPWKWRYPKKHLKFKKNLMKFMKRY